jgi:hypothetical protein
LYSRLGIPVQRFESRKRVKSRCMGLANHGWRGGVLDCSCTNYEVVWAL